MAMASTVTIKAQSTQMWNSNVFETKETSEEAMAKITFDLSEFNYPDMPDEEPTHHIAEITLMGVKTASTATKSNTNGEMDDSAEMAWPFPASSSAVSVENSLHKEYVENKISLDDIDETVFNDCMFIVPQTLSECDAPMLQIKLVDEFGHYMFLNESLKNVTLSMEPGKEYAIKLTNTQNSDSAIGLISQVPTAREHSR